jgi:hypothetical protein
MRGDNHICQHQNLLILRPLIKAFLWPAFLLNPIHNCIKIIIDDSIRWWLVQKAEGKQMYAVAWLEGKWVVLSVLVLLFVFDLFFEEGPINSVET